MESQREKARAKSAFDGKKAEEFTFSDPSVADRLRVAGDRFEGYTTTSCEGRARAGAVRRRRARQVARTAGRLGGIRALDRTPFYLESGGQVSDVGTLQNEAGTVLARVTGVLRLGAGAARGAPGERRRPAPLVDEQAVSAVVDDVKRDATRRNHTATHLLHAALRQTLGTHVKQAGSLVAPDRLRFDFTHFAAITPARPGADRGDRQRAGAA